MCSVPPFFLLAAIATLLVCATCVQANGNGCHLQKHLSSCDDNKLRYSVIVDGRPGEKIVINHSIERIPPSTKAPIVRAPNPVQSRAALARRQRLERLRADWRARTAAFKQKTAELLEKRRARLRNMRPLPVA